MCTVTYVPLSERDFILTSSRDVPFSREKADFPKKEENNGIKLWYPKDGKAGGTWIGTSSKNRLICLLNGGFEYHTSRANYRKSRGLIVKELLKSDDIKIALEEVDLVDIEQFTLIVVDWNDSLKLMEFVWDGSQKHLKEMPQEFHIWSSSTLYDAEVKKLRKDWFKDWQQKNDQSQKSILEFHHEAGIGDPHLDVLMNRGMGGTVSITSILKKEASIHWHYEDVRNSNVLPLKLQYKSQK
jgi:hypothetical protein